MGQKAERGPTKSQIALLNTIRREGGVFIDKKADRDDRAFFRSGRSVDKDRIDRLIQRGLLRPVDDGLFPEISQSFVAADA